MSRYLKILLTIVAAAAMLTLLVGGAGIGAYYYVAPSLPRAEDLRNVKIAVPLQVFSRDGRLIAEYGDIKRTPVSYADIPPLLIKAVLAAEDEHFFEHPGVDYRGVLRGILNEISPNGRTVGGSTITQQVTRTLNVLSRSGLASGPQRFVNKFKEWILAFRIEGEFTKQEILALYLNTYFFGQRSYGVVTAARTYFGKDLDELTVSETAILAGIPQRPSDLNPIASPERAAARRAYVLRRMSETGAITDAQYQAALAEPVIGKRYGTETQLDAPYLGEMVRAEMFRRFGAEAYTAGFKVTTSIDSRLQKAANRGMHDTLLAYDERHGYRGPLAHVDLPAAATAENGPASAAAELRALLDDYPNVVDYETGIVLAVEPESAHVFFADRGEQTVGFDALSWAAPFVNDDAVGTRPTSVPEVLKSGDIVRFRRDAAGRWRLAQIPEVEGAFASVDPLDGGIVALTGGFDFFLSNYNRATQAKRQPGSSFKPFIYSAALQNGFTPATIVNDSPPEGEYQAELERVWRPENFNGEYFGFVSLRFALQHSLNAVSIRITKAMGVPTAVRYVRKFGFDDTAIPNNLSIALGAGGVAPIDLVTGYATFANGGYRVDHYFIQRIANAAGEVLYEANPAFVCADCGQPTPVAPAGSIDCARPAPVVQGAGPAPAPAPQADADPTALNAVAPQAITPQNAYLMTDLMQDVVRSGTGAAAWRALERHDIAGKTGTTNEGHDTWFVGFNSDVVAAAWVGFDQDRSLGGREQGGFTAIPMWIDYMREALAHQPEHTLARPLGIVEYRINPGSGLIANDATRDTVFEKFDIDNVPAREPDQRFVAPDSTTPTATAHAGDPLFD